MQLGNWIGHSSQRKVIAKLEQYKLMNGHYPDSLNEIGIEETIKKGLNFRYRLVAMDFELCSIYDEEHSFGPRPVGDCYDSRSNKWKNLSDVTKDEFNGGNNI